MTDTKTSQMVPGNAWRSAAVASFFSSARLVAIGRLALALSMLVLAATDPGHVGFRWEPDDTISLAYLIISAFAAWLAWNDWWLDYLARGWLLAVDLLIFVLLPSLIEPALDGYRIASLTCATFILLSVALRWNWQSAGVTALVLNLLNWLLVTYHPVGTLFGFLPERFEVAAHTDYIRSIYYLLLISLLIVWVGSRIAVPKVPGMSVSGLRSIQALVDHALEYVLRLSDANRALVIWEREEPARSVHGASRPEGQYADHRWQLPEQLGSPRMIDRRRRRQIACVEGDLETQRLDPAMPDWDEIATARTVIVVPLEGASGRGVLVVLDPSAASTDRFEMLLNGGTEISRAADRIQARRLDREEAFAKVRRGLARDLHDSVVQSIAGTRLWLKNLAGRDDTPEYFAGELSRIDDALRAEGEHLRTMIARLRDEENYADFDSSAQLEKLAADLEKQWRVKIDLDIGEDITEIRAETCFEIAQLIRESVSNAVRHGRASNISITFTRHSSFLTVRIDDNGSGFASGPTPRPPRTLAQRMDALGGSVEAASGSQGAKLTFLVPLKGS